MYRRDIAKPYIGGWDGLLYNIVRENTILFFSYAPTAFTVYSASFCDSNNRRER